MCTQRHLANVVADDLFIAPAASASLPATVQATI
jgi:hypothetical protein